MKFNFKSSVLFFLCLTLFSCDSNRWEIDVQKVEIQQAVNRFELDLFEAAKDSLDNNEHWGLLKKYPQFYPLFTEGIMGLGEIENPQTLQIINQFVANKDIQDLYADVAKTFPAGNLDKEWEQVKNGFKRFHFYFPDRIVPQINTMISAFSYAAAADDSLMAVGLDTYLGGDYIVYPTVGIPKYKFKNFSIEYMPTDVMNAWLLTEFETEGGQNLLEQMIFRGKTAYLTHVFMPENELAYVFNYDKEDLLWCEENESQIWSHFIEMELLFASETNQIRKYMGDAPFVSGFPEGSPGRVGHWVGYKIVDAFMKNNKEVGLAALMKIKDANRILRKSNYKPKR